MISISLFTARAAKRDRPLDPRALLALCTLIAGRVGLVALIADARRLLAWLLIARYAVPLLTTGGFRLFHRSTPEFA